MSENTEKSKKKSPNKARNWACVIYPDSMPQNWEQIIQLSGLKCALSPIHDKDTDPTEEEKKPHYHLIFVWHKGSTTKKVAERFSKQLNGTIPIALESVRGYYRYLTHKDNPEKYQYDEKDIRFFNGFDIADFVEKTRSEIRKLKQELRKYIRENNIYSYAVLLDTLDDNSLLELLDIAENHTLMITNYLKARKDDYINGYKITLREKEIKAEVYKTFKEKYGVIIDDEEQEENANGVGCGECNANGVERPHD